ncbi:Zn-ribbon domain-containing OB-fold protein [Chloroflexota bacterium]
MRKNVIEGAFYVPASPQEQPYLKGSQCSKCGYVAFPPKGVCPMCVRDDTMTGITLRTTGKLESFTIVRQAPPGFTAPYMLGMVRLPEGPEIFSIITGCEVKDDVLKIGQEMELVIEKIRDDDEGNEIIGWKFKPAAVKEATVS